MLMNTPGRMPSLNALRMFEAAAHYGNFTRAAESLFVTQGAVSRQVKRLEDDLGEPLFRRDGPRIELTQTGTKLYDSAQEAFGILRRSMAEIRRRSSGPAGSALTISTLPSFAAKWLIPRLTGFQDANETIDLRLSASYRPVDFSRQADVDVAIRFGEGPGRGLYRECLASEVLFPVCSPAFRRKHTELRDAADIARLPLLYASESYDQWDDWFSAAGVKPPGHHRGPRYTDALLLQKAASEGHGVALARSLIVEEDLVAGRLLRLSELSIPSRNNIYFVCPAGRETEPGIASFLGWLRTEVLETDFACDELMQ